MQSTGQTAMQGASEQCMQATEIERSPGLPSLMVTTRRRLIPQGTSCSFLQAVTQALHSMQRSASQRNFIRAITCSSFSRCPDLAERDLWFLHAGGRIVAVGGDRIGAFTEHDRVGARRVIGPEVLAVEPAAEVERHEGDAPADPLGHQGLHPGLDIVLGAQYQDPCPVADAALG